jgi:Rieske 2Fe-2S family protein
VTATELPASLISTLPGRYYTDQDIFTAEQSAIFESLWFCALRSSELARPGDFRTVRIGRESVLVTRTRDGDLRAFLNVCRHRGARIRTEERGSVRRAFQCSYHAWTYGLDGKLIAAPNLTSMPDIDRTEYGLRPVHLKEWLGYCWLSLAAQPPSFTDTVMGAVTERLGSADLIDNYRIDELVVGKHIRYDVRANWKLIIENFMECYHCATIHPELTEVLPEFASGYAAQYYVGHGAEFGDGIGGFTVDGRPGFGRLDTLADDQDRRYYAITVQPQVFINLVPDHVILHRMYPLGVDNTVVECDWLYAPDVVAQGLDVSHSVELFHRVNQQDFAACERCQPAMASRGYADGGVLVPSEHHIGAFHNWVRTMLGETG